MIRPAEWKHDTQDVQDRTALITGGTTGIGRATALLLASRGAKVMVFGRRKDHLEEALRDLQQTGEAFGMPCDQTRPEEVERVFDEVDQRFGKLDVLINNAAEPANTVAEDSPQDIDYAVRDNLVGYMTCAHHAVRRMKEHKGGHIINIGSMTAQTRTADSGVYTATKAGIRAWSESLRKSVNEHGIKVSLIEPGLVGTDFIGVPADEQPQKQHEQKMLTAEDIAECVLYCLTQPARCDVVSVQIRPHLETI